MQKVMGSNLLVYSNNEVSRINYVWTEIQHDSSSSWHMKFKHRLLVYEPSVVHECLLWSWRPNPHHPRAPTHEEKKQKEHSTRKLRASSSKKTDMINQKTKTKKIIGKDVRTSSICT